MSRSSESHRWYDREGNPQYTTIYKNGNEGSVTLREARKHGYVPSFSDIKGIINKPQLNRHLQNEIIKSSWECEVSDDFETYYKAVMDVAFADSLGKASIGTDIHAKIEQGFLGKGNNPYYEAIRECLDSLKLYDEWIPEKSFAHSLGYGGKVDLHAKNKRIVVDYKTKDFSDEFYGECVKDDRKVAKFIYTEHGMQLSAYGLGLYNREDAVRVNIFIRPKDAKCLPYIHKEETNKTDLEKFKCLLRFWQLENKYDSSF